MARRYVLVYTYLTNERSGVHTIFWCSPRQTKRSVKLIIGRFPSVQYKICNFYINWMTNVLSFGVQNNERFTVRMTNVRFCSSKWRTLYSKNDERSFCCPKWRTFYSKNDERSFLLTQMTNVLQWEWRTFVLLSQFFFKLEVKNSLSFSFRGLSATSSF